MLVMMLLGCSTKLLPTTLPPTGEVVTLILAFAGIRSYAPLAKVRVAPLAMMMSLVAKWGVPAGSVRLEVIKMGCALAKPNERKNKVMHQRALVFMNFERRGWVKLNIRKGLMKH